MYVSTSWSRVYALDAATGRQLWHFDAHVAGRIGFDACCDVVSRGVAVADGRVFLAALDGRLIALDAKSGKTLWSVATTDPAKPYTITGAPRVMGNKVIIGNRRFRVRCARLRYRLCHRHGQAVLALLHRAGEPDGDPDGDASDRILKKAATPDLGRTLVQHGGGGTV